MLKKSFLLKVSSELPQSGCKKAAHITVHMPRLQGLIADEKWNQHVEHIFGVKVASIKSPFLNRSIQAKVAKEVHKVSSHDLSLAFKGNIFQTRILADTRSKLPKVAHLLSV